MDDNSAPSNTIKVLLRMSLNEFVVNMSKVMDKQVRPYLMLRVDRLRIDSAITQYGFASHATLGGIQLVDKIHVGRILKHFQTNSYLLNELTWLLMLLWGAAYNDNIQQYHTGKNMYFRHVRNDIFQKKYFTSKLSSYIITIKSN